MTSATNCSRTLSTSRSTGRLRPHVSGHEPGGVRIRVHVGIHPCVRDQQRGAVPISLVTCPLQRPPRGWRSVDTHDDTVDLITTASSWYDHDGAPGVPNYVTRRPPQLGPLVAVVVVAQTDDDEVIGAHEIDQQGGNRIHRCQRDDFEIRVGRR